LSHTIAVPPRYRRDIGIRGSATDKDQRIRIIKDEMSNSIL
jgi:hypothetical protein